MKTAFRVGLLILAALTLPATAHAYGCPLFPCIGCPRPCVPRLAPWYCYFPYEAHFQAPAPVGPFPNWQPGAMVPAGGASYAPPVHQPAGYVQPVGYSSPPSYWYGNR